MDPGFEEAFEDLVNSQLGEELPPFVIKRLQDFDHPRRAIWEARALKDTANVLFKAQDFQRAVLRYETALQFLCASFPICAQDVQLMSELAITLNSNLAACWLRLEQYESAKFHCELAMKFDAYNVKVRYRRALALLNLGMVEDARLDLEIALKFEPKNKFVVKELKILQEKYGFKGETSSFNRTLHEGKNVFDPLHIQESNHNCDPKGKGSGVLCSHEAASHSKETNLIDDGGVGEEVDKISVRPTSHMDVMTETLEVDPEVVLSSKRFKCSQENQPNVRDMDVDNQSFLLSPSQENLTRNLTTTVGVSPTAKPNVNPSQNSENLKEDMIIFSNPRKPNCYLRISRKVYQQLVEGRQLSYTLASQQDRLSVRMLAAPRKLNSSRNFSNKKELISSRDEKDVEVVLGEATSTISSEYSNNINSNMECEEQSISMGFNNMDVEEEEVGSNFSESHVTQLSPPFFFKASSKSNGKRIRMSQSCFRYFRTRSCRNMSSASSSSITKVYGKSLKSKIVHYCRNQARGCQGRKRKISNKELQENCINKRRFTVNHGPEHAIQAEEECCTEVSFSSCSESVSRVSVGFHIGL